MLVTTKIENFAMFLILSSMYFLRISLEKWFHHSVLQYSEDIYDFLANFFKLIVQKGGQKLILVDNFISKNNDDFYVLQLCFYDIFWLDQQK